MSLPRYRPIRPCQRGAALLVSLVMLLLLTVIALAGVSDSTLQQRMAHNSRQLNKSFQAAESALRHLEQQLEAGLLSLPTDPCQPLCEVPVTVLNGAAGSAPGADWSQLPVSGNEVGLVPPGAPGRQQSAGWHCAGQRCHLYRVTYWPARVRSELCSRRAMHSCMRLPKTTGAGVAPQAFQRVAWRQLH